MTTDNVGANAGSVAVDVSVAANSVCVSMLRVDVNDTPKLGRIAVSVGTEPQILTDICPGGKTIDVAKFRVSFQQCVARVGYNRYSSWNMATLAS